MFHFQREPIELKRKEQRVKLKAFRKIKIAHLASEKN